MGENDKTNQGTPPSGQSSGSQGVITSQQAPETYTKNQVMKMVSDANAELGRKHKAELSAVVKERDTYKSQVELKDSELQDVASEREKLQIQIDELSSDDPEKFNLVKKDKELREKERQLKADRQALETDRKTHQERIKLAEDTLREVSTWEIAAEYDGGDAVKLKDLCDIFSASSDEQIRKVADTLWSKKAVAKPSEPPSAPLKPDSGATIGGGQLTIEQVKKMSPSERIARAKEIAALPLGLR